MSRSAAASASPLTQKNVATTSDRMICRTLAERRSRIDQRLPQRVGIGFEHGPDVALGKQHLVPHAGEALANDRQTASQEGTCGALAK
jgi:hypothetical protein